MSKRVTTTAFQAPESTRANAPGRERGDGSWSEISPEQSFLGVQRAIGHRAVRGLLVSGILQPKLRIGAPNDRFEREADRMADSVTRMPAPDGVTSIAQVSSPSSETVRRQPLEDEEEELLQPKADPGTRNRQPGAGIDSRVAALRGGGRPLAPSERSFFEPRFGHDFSDVRVHTGGAAAEASQSIGARAFTLGRNVVFGAGEYTPESPSGRHLLAHELTHVVQQTPFVARRKAWVQRRPASEKKEEPKWENDHYYDKGEKEKAQRRVKKLKQTWADTRIIEIKVKGETKWQVQKLGPQKKASEDEAKKKSEWTPDTEKFEKRKDAEKRKKVLVAEDEWKKYRVKKVEEVKEGEKSYYRVEMRGKLKPGTTEFALTFDDGPHTESLGSGQNRTENVLNTLASEGIKGEGAFFVQTHAPYRGSTKIGMELIKRMFDEGYTVGIHTGGKKKHESHPLAQKAGRLEGELKGAKSHLKSITGSDPGLVRAPYGETNPDVLKVYAKLQLKHVHWDIDGDPGGSLPLPELQRLFDVGLAALRRGSRGTYHPNPRTGSSRIVVLYHDIREGTSNNIGAMIKYIKKRVPKVKFGKP